MDICQCVPYAKKCDVIERKQKNLTSARVGGHVYEERGGKGRRKRKKERETCRVGLVDV